jgi:hypothetical protein
MTFIPRPDRRGFLGLTASAAPGDWTMPANPMNLCISLEEVNRLFWPVQRCVRILEKAGYKGVYALESEDGPWDGVDGARYLYQEVLAAL